QPQGIAPVVVRVEEVEEPLLRVVLDYLDLLDNHMLFPLDVLFPEGGSPAHVGEQVEGEVRVLAEHPRVEAGILLAGEGFEHAGHGIDLPRYVMGGPSLGPLEE